MTHSTRREIEVEYDPFGPRLHRYVARLCSGDAVGYGATPARAIRDLLRAVAEAAKQMRLAV
jgi:hypothetical protein